MELWNHHGKERVKLIVLIYSVLKHIGINSLTDGYSLTSQLQFKYNYDRCMRSIDTLPLIEYHYHHRFQLNDNSQTRNHQLR